MYFWVRYLISTKQPLQRFSGRGSLFSITPWGQEMVQPSSPIYCPPGLSLIEDLSTSLIVSPTLATILTDFNVSVNDPSTSVILSILFISTRLHQPIPMIHFILNRWPHLLFHYANLGHQILSFSCPHPTLPRAVSLHVLTSFLFILHG